MKKLEKLKLNQVNKNELLKEQMINLKGGYECSPGTLCQCPSVPPGGIQTSSSNAEWWKNFAQG
jgi:natural product precursor